MSEIVFLKLGGSLITDKTGIESPRTDVMQRISAEIVRARQNRADLKLVLGHGSGSFGHVAAGRHKTRSGVFTADQWQGFVEVSDAAARLNALVRTTLLKAGLPVITIQPSSSALCQGGTLSRLDTSNILQALEEGLIPLVYGDVSFDTKLGGTIISTEEIFVFLARVLKPTKILLAGEVDGVIDDQGELIRMITPSMLPALTSVLGGSRGTDVTGGMVSKVREMIQLITSVPDLTVSLFSGLAEDNIFRLLATDEPVPGTIIAPEGI